MEKKKRNQSDIGENSMGSSNGEMLGYRLSNSLSLLNCPTLYLITTIESYPHFGRNQPVLEEFLCIFTRLGSCKACYHKFNSFKYALSFSPTSGCFSPSFTVALIKLNLSPVSSHSPCNSFP